MYVCVFLSSYATINRSLLIHHNYNYWSDDVQGKALTLVRKFASIW